MAAKRHFCLLPTKESVRRPTPTGVSQAHSRQSKPGRTAATSREPRVERLLARQGAAVVGAACAEWIGQRIHRSRGLILRTRITRPRRRVGR